MNFAILVYLQTLQKLCKEHKRNGSLRWSSIVSYCSNNRVNYQNSISRLFSLKRLSIISYSTFASYRLSNWGSHSGITDG
nr:hypothetical protein CFP56_24771 [Quercus suber]